MIQSKDIRDEAAIAEDLLNFTGRSLFLTGKAGTGKTTFLLNFLAKTQKKAVVVAPTGVAAINAGGMTIHSLFQFPPGLFVPATSGGYGQDNVFNRSSLTKSIFLSKSKRKLLNSIDLLVIDEVSMLRADLLDAMDTMLRSIRKNYNEPMGGVQVLYIGDLWQLPPVVKDQDWAVLGSYYQSPFFFSAAVIEESPPVIIELTKIYRQQDEQFIHLLNNIRNNTLHKDDYYELNKRYQPDNIDYDRDNYIILTTHNYKANQINMAKLQQLDGDAYTYSSEIQGDFSENSYPNETELTLKVGAQVMFLKNDSEEKKRYYNGKIGSVTSIRLDKDDEPEIEVTFPDGIEMILEKESWNNLRFEYNQEEDKVDEKVLGTFTQYPVKPAWAITIHKSQGLTFEEVVIDAGRAFAPGQVYVALSRCTTLNGIMLLSEITDEAISTDERVVNFTSDQPSIDDLEQILADERVAFEQQLVLDVFRLNALKEVAYHAHDIYKDRKPSPKLGVQEFASKVSKQGVDLLGIADKYRNELIKIFREDAKNINRLKERMGKAVPYFTAQIIEQIFYPIIQLDLVLSKAKKVKAIRTKLNDLEVNVRKQINQLQRVQYLGSDLYEGDSMELNALKSAYLGDVETDAEESAKQANLSSHEVSLQLFQDGKSVAEVAVERGLVEGTIYSHAAKLIKDNLLNVEHVLDQKSIDLIQATIDTFEKKPSVGQLRTKLNNQFSYGICACVLNVGS